MVQKMACPHVLCFEEHHLHDEDDSRKGYEEVSEGSKLRMDVRCPFAKKKQVVGDFRCAILFALQVHLTSQVEVCADVQGGGDEVQEKADEEVSPIEPHLEVHHLPIEFCLLQFEDPLLQLEHLLPRLPGPLRLLLLCCSNCRKPLFFVGEVHIVVVVVVVVDVGDMLYPVSVFNFHTPKKYVANPIIREVLHLPPFLLMVSNLLTSQSLLLSL